MKRIIFAFILISFALSHTTDTKAMEYMAGAKTGYYAWQPYLKDAGASGMSDIDWGTGMLYGPIVSLIFTPDISFSLAGLLGKQSTHWQSIKSDFSSTSNVTGNYYFEAFRADFDSALSYRLAQNFKIFAGYKYQYLNLTYKYTEIRTSALDGSIDEINVMEMDDMESPSHGPALGLGFSLPLGRSYFLSANLSGLYMWAKWNLKFKRYDSDGSSALNLVDNSSLTVKMQQIGLNFEPAVGFNPGEGLPVITLGFRFQRFWVKIKDIGGDDFSDKTLDDTLIGGFVSAVFMF